MSEITTRIERVEGGAIHYLDPNLSKYQYSQLAQLILENPLRFRWSLQGFGMLRFYITQDIRLHVWDSRYKVANVSGIHTHPWHFTSHVLAGRVEQHRYKILAELPYLEGERAFDEYRIRCGVGGSVLPDPVRVELEAGPREIIGPGGSYQQIASEIHLSEPADGTVTIVVRELAHSDDPDHALVYVPAGEEWVSAEPRDATEDEVRDICYSALREGFGNG